MNWKKEWKKAYRDLEIPRAADVLPSKAELTGVQKTPANTQKAKREIPLRRIAAVAACLALLAGIVPLGITVMRQYRPPVTPGTESGTPLDTNPSVTPVTKPPVIEPPENGVHSADELVERIRDGGFIYYADPSSATVIEPDPDGKYYYANCCVTDELLRALRATTGETIFAVDLHDEDEQTKLSQFTVNGRTKDMVKLELWSYEKAYCVYRTLYELGEANITGDELTARLVAIREWRDYLPYSRLGENKKYLAAYDALGVNVDDYLTELPDVGLAVAVDRIAPALEDCEAAIERLNKEYDEIEAAAYRANPVLSEEAVEALVERGYDVYSYFMYGWQQHVAILVTKDEFEEISSVLGSLVDLSKYQFEFLPGWLITRDDVTTGFISPVPCVWTPSPTGKITGWMWEYAIQSRSMEELRALCPQYFELSVENGVEVYAFARDWDVTLCAIFPKADHVRTLDEIYAAPFIPDCEAVNILLTYDGLTEDQITVHAIPDPVAVWEGVEPGMEDFCDEVFYTYYRDRWEALKKAGQEQSEIPDGMQRFTYTPTEWADNMDALFAHYETLDLLEISALVPDSWKIAGNYAGEKDGFGCSFTIDYCYLGTGGIEDDWFYFVGPYDWSYSLEGTTDSGVSYYGREISEKQHAENPGYYHSYQAEIVLKLPDHCCVDVYFSGAWEDSSLIRSIIQSFSCKKH